MNTRAYYSTQTLLSIERARILSDNNPSQGGLTYHCRGVGHAHFSLCSTFCSALMPRGSIHVSVLQFVHTNFSEFFARGSPNPGGKKSIESLQLMKMGVTKENPRAVIWDAKNEGPGVAKSNQKNGTNFCPIIAQHSKFSPIPGPGFCDGDRESN